MAFEAGRLPAEQLFDLLQRQECLIQHLFAEVQRLKQRLAQYEPAVNREPIPTQADPPSPSASYSVESEERRRRPRRRKKKSPGRRPTELKFAQAQRVEEIYFDGVPRADCQLSVSAPSGACWTTAPCWSATASSAGPAAPSRPSLG